MLVWKPRTLVFALLLAAMVAGCGRRGSRDLYKLGLFQFNSNVTLDATREGFLKALEDAEFEHGANIYIEVKNAEGDIPTTQLIARRFVADGFDLICPISTQALQAALHATKGTNRKVVFAAIADPYRLGAGKSAEVHLPNVTGCTAPAPVAEPMRIAKKIVPGLHEIGIVWDPGQENSQFYMQIARKAAKEMELNLVEATVTGSQEVMQATQSLVTKVEVVQQIGDNTVQAAIDALIRVCSDAGVPVVSGFPLTAEKGALVAVGWDYFEYGYEGGKVAARVIRGENPATIPFQTPQIQELILNMRAARALGIRLPADLLERADRVIE